MPESTTEFESVLPNTSTLHSKLGLDGTTTNADTEPCKIIIIQRYQRGQSQQRSTNHLTIEEIDDNEGIDIESISVSMASEPSISIRNPDSLGSTIDSGYCNVSDLDAVKSSSSNNVNDDTANISASSQSSLSQPSHSHMQRNLDPLPCDGKQLSPHESASKSKVDESHDVEPSYDHQSI
uniref:Uncharacterized protein n=1 Tax=Lygus hesperus TaxID=30085 RepID=A0A0A9XXG7_LYGHE